MFLDAKVFDGYSNIFNLSIDDLICKEINNENLNAEKDRALITIKHVLSF
ncbi:wffS domain protein [Escherichia coli 174750]|nr:wffS domain protein [Escherichia coli 174750]